MDPIADMLTTLLNAQRVQKKRVALPYSRFKEELLALLQAKKIIGSYRVQESPIAKLVVTLAYDEWQQPHLNGVRRLSKPGGRVYVQKTDIPYSRDGAGLVVVSTSQGLMIDKEARKAKLGGEVICEIW